MANRYHAGICDHYQRSGHLETNCTAKTNGDAPCCYKCTGDHRSKDCTSVEKKCINCVRYKKPVVNHSANDRCGPVQESEIERIRNSTDYGY